MRCAADFFNEIGAEQPDQLLPGVGRKLPPEGAGRAQKRHRTALAGAGSMPRSRAALPPKNQPALPVVEAW